MHGPPRMVGSNLGLESIEKQGVKGVSRFLRLDVPEGKKEDGYSFAEKDKRAAGSSSENGERRGGASGCGLSMLKAKRGSRPPGTEEKGGDASRLLYGEGPVQCEGER